MNFAIEFDNKSLFQAAKIHDEVINRMLPSEFVSPQCARS